MHSYTERVIYCVVPPELEEELFEKLREYYKDNPHVQVIIDRRAGQQDGSFKEQREIRDRRRARAPGTFPETDAPSD